MRILIIGGSGFIGPDVIKQLNSKGHEVILFNNGQTKAELPPCFKHIIGDLRNFTDFKDEFKRLGPEVVLEDMFHFSDKDALTVISTLKGITRRIVAISGTDVYRAFGRLFGMEPGPIEPVPLTEESPLRQIVALGMGGYDKLLVEPAIMSDPDMPGTILRLPVIYGPRSLMHRVYFYLKRMDDKRPVIPLSKELANWRWSHGYVENIAAAITLAVIDEHATGRIYNLGEVEPISMAEWVKKIGKFAGWDGEIAFVPKNRLPEFTPFTMMKINTEQDIIHDSSRIRKELGYTESVPLDEALKLTIEWERLNPIPHFYLNPTYFDYSAEDSLLMELGLRGGTYH